MISYQLLEGRTFCVGALRGRAILSNSTEEVVAFDDFDGLKSPFQRPAKR